MKCSNLLKIQKEIAEFGYESIAQNRYTSTVILNQIIITIIIHLFYLIFSIILIEVWEQMIQVKGHTWSKCIPADITPCCTGTVSTYTC